MGTVKPCLPRMFPQSIRRVCSWCCTIMRHEKNVGTLSDNFQGCNFMWNSGKINKKSKRGVCKFPRWQDSPKSLNYRSAQKPLLIRPFIFEPLLIIGRCISLFDRGRGPPGQPLSPVLVVWNHFYSFRDRMASPSQGYSVFLAMARTRITIQRIAYKHNLYAIIHKPDNLLSTTCVWCEEAKLEFLVKIYCITKHTLS